MRLQWNALCVGDVVHVHDDDDRNFDLVPGRVTTVPTANGHGDVGIMISPPGRPVKLVHPERLAVHLDAVPGDESCWRCVVVR